MSFLILTRHILQAVRHQATPLTTDVLRSRTHTCRAIAIVEHSEDCPLLESAFHSLSALIEQMQEVDGELSSRIVAAAIKVLRMAEHVRTERRRALPVAGGCGLTPLWSWWWSDGPLRSSTSVWISRA